METPDGVVISYSRFLSRASTLAHALTRLGLKPGDRVAVQLDKSVEMLALYAACVQAGFVFLPLNTAYTATELSYFLENSGARVFLTPSRVEEAKLDAAIKLGTEHCTLDADGTGTLGELARGQSSHFETVPRGPDDLAAILYTSGTTGRSKGAMLSQQNLLSNARTLVDAWRFTSGDRLLHALPIFHTHGLFVGTNVTLLAGGSMLFLPRFDLDSMIAMLPRSTVMMGVPTYYTRLLADDRFTAALVEDMRLFISGSAPLLSETHEAFATRTGHRILERYGMTETNMTCSNPYEGERRAGTVGPPLPGIEVRVRDAAGKPLATDEIGVLEVRGPNVFKGYWQMPEKTAEEMRDDGFFITGDLASISGDGYVTIVGRSRDLVISGGFNVYPKEVEVLLDRLDGVVESAVIGVPHPDLGEAVVAVIATGHAVAPDPNHLSEALADQLAAFKKPKHYAFVEELPRNTMGKVQKAALRAQFDGLFSEP
nr:malonyl-CoA synthase [Pelagovum pacificum]